MELDRALYFQMLHTV